jgi:hypothetical protein
MLRWIRNHGDEIAADPALRAYGAALALLHPLTAYWIRRDDKLAWLTPAAEAICWPFFPDCERLRVLSLAQLETATVLWALGGALVALGFAWRRTTRAALAGLLLLAAFEVALLALDFRLRRNQHMMALWVTGAFLLVPGRRRALPLLICLFYFWAGTIKLNWEWISGAAVGGRFWPFSGAGLIAACLYVIALELGVVWGLLARRAWMFWGALAQLALFHALSWQTVGFFYPILMAGILAIFPLARLLPRPSPAGWRPALALAALFSALQLTPYLFPGDRTVTGEGRLFALHMIDAHVQCRAWAELRLEDGRTQRVHLRRHHERRTRCDPIVIHGEARNLCRARDAGRRRFADFRLRLESRRASDGGALRSVIDLPDFCAASPRYDPFRHNGWIAAQ